MLRCVAVLVPLLACGKHAGPPTSRDDGASPPARLDASVHELAPRALGMPALDGFAWRTRAGQAAFRIARKAEGREDWPNVATACQQALAADPGHLEAAWLYAVALAKTGKPGAVTEPLAVAGAGDFGKWALASLEQPALQSYLATPDGAAWRRRVEADRASYAAALARSLVVIAGGDLYAFDPTGPRWYRLTRTYGAVIGAFAAPDHHLAFVTRSRGKAAKQAKLGLGVVDLATGRSSHPLELVAPAQVAYAATKPGGFWLKQGHTTRLVDGDGIATTVDKLDRPAGPWLEITIGGGLHAHRLPVPSIAADWDDQSLASAIRIATSNRVVTAPGLIDGNTLVWAPDRAHLAFVAQLSDQCTPGTPNNAAFVADAATGTVQELERATGGLAIEWRSERSLAIAGDSGVSLVELGGAVTKVDGATGLVAPRRKARCTPEPSVPEPVDDDPAESGTGEDAGTSPHP